MKRTKFKVHKSPITTLQMEVLLLEHFDYTSNYIVSNLSFGADIHECDLLVLTPSGFAREVEIKISKQDLLNDKLKPHGHHNYKIKELWFAVPIKLEQIALEVIPKRAGLLVVYEKPIGKWRVGVKKLPVIESNPYKWANDEIFNLLRLGTMQIMTLKKKILKLKQ